MVILLKIMVLLACPRGACGCLRGIPFGRAAAWFGRLEFGLFQPLGVLSDGEVVDAVLYVAVHECREVVDGVVDAVVGDATLRVVVGADLCAAVTGADEALAARGDVVDVLLVLAVVDECA